MKTLAASDRSALIRLASTLPKGSEERRAILAGLKDKKRASKLASRRFLPILKSCFPKTPASQVISVFEGFLWDIVVVLWTPEKALHKGQDLVWDWENITIDSDWDFEVPRAIKVTVKPIPVLWSETKQIMRELKGDFQCFLEAINDRAFAKWVAESLKKTAVDHFEANPDEVLYFLVSDNPLEEWVGEQMDNPSPYSITYDDGAFTPKKTLSNKVDVKVTNRGVVISCELIIELLIDHRKIDIEDPDTPYRALRHRYRLASSLPKGSEERRAILAGLEKASSLKWAPLTGSGLAKAQRMFKYNTEDWYALDNKVLGKTVFLRDHGVATLYVVGPDGFAYSIKGSGGMGSFTKRDIQELVDTAIAGDTSMYPKSGIYKNMRV